jgi:hypothetical protein
MICAAREDVVGCPNAYVLNATITEELWRDYGTAVGKYGGWNEIYGGYTKQQRIAELGRLIMEGKLHQICLSHLPGVNAGSLLQDPAKDGAAGVNKMAGEQYKEEFHENFSDLAERFKSGSFAAPTVKRVYFPRG